MSAAAGETSKRSLPDTYDPIARQYWLTEDEHPPLVTDNWLYAGVRMITKPVFRALFQIEVVGGTNVPISGPVVLAASHRSNIDTPFLGLVTARPVNFMAKQEFFKRNWALRFFRGMGAFPVNRAAADRNALERALRVLSAGAVLGIYPEGTRRSGPRITEVHRGPAWIAIRSGAVVVPVGIGGSASVQPRGSSGIKLAKVRMVCGAPLAPPASRSKRAELKFTDELVAGIQAAFDAAGGEGPLERVPRSSYVRGF